MKLDRKKPFGVISGEADGAVYEQDGKHFGTDENEIVAEVKAIVSTADTQPKAKAKAKGKASAAAVEPEAPVELEVPADPIDAQLVAQGAE